MATAMTESINIISGKGYQAMEWNSDDNIHKAMNVLGSGAFSDVFRIPSPVVPCFDDEGTTNNGESIEIWSSHDEYCAVKKLNQGTLADPWKAQDALACMALEASILTTLQGHDNIIKLHAVSTHMNETSPQNYFLVMECLDETLADRFDRMKQYLHPPARNARSSLFGMHSIKQDQERKIAEIAYGLAMAFEFLNSHNIVHRDLKPDNVGFKMGVGGASTGQVKLFDFGCARRFTLESLLDRCLTLRVGAFRYMSPENAMGHIYGFPNDVYSFGILLWEMLSGERAFSRTKTIALFKKSVYELHERPSLKTIANPAIASLIQRCWCHDPEFRPNFKEIVHALRKNCGGTLP